MNLPRRAFVRLCSWFVAASLSWQNGKAQKKAELGGRVVDDSNKPVGDVLVSIFRDGTRIGGGSTHRTTGEYAIPFDTGTPITTVTYQLTRYSDGTVANLCGDCGHRICKTLYRFDRDLQLFEALEVLYAYEVQYYVASFNKRLDSVKGPNITALKELRIPSGLRERRDMVIRLYGV